MVINNVTVTSRTPPHYVIVSLSPTQSGVVEKKHGVCVYNRRQWHWSKTYLISVSFLGV